MKTTTIAKQLMTVFAATSVAISLTACTATEETSSKETTVVDGNSYQNPIIPGYAPDPTIVRVGEDYYLANSSFEWFPAVPIYHSKDLVNWELISYAVSDPEFLELIKVGKSRGIYAPTLRHHEGTFYMITTCVQCGGNFYVTAKDIKGPWSKPIWVDGNGSRGIDPDLFWHEGKSYYTGTGILDKSKTPYPNPNGIWTQEIDLETGKLLGKKTQLTYGHANNARWTEGPHLFHLENKKGEKRFVLMTAEGGTGDDHAVTLHESDTIQAPFFSHYKNPIITQRNLGEDAHIHSSGHADLVQTQNGEWWMVLLAKRKWGEDGKKKHTMLARETFMVPVKMENGWPVASPGTGDIQNSYQRPNLPWTPIPEKPVRDEFTAPELDLEFNMLRNPASKWYALEEGQLVLDTRAESAAEDKVNPSMLVRRTRDIQYSASTKLNFNASKKEIAGLVVYRDFSSFYQLVKQEEHVSLSHVRRHWGKDDVHTHVATLPYTADEVIFKVEATEDLKLSFSFGADESALQSIGGLIDATNTSDEAAGGFHGTYVGMYTSSQGLPSSNKAKFDWFEYQGFDRAK